MGAIRPIKLSNGNEGIEITYGGKESPFGGVDTSAPPAYIDPKCFAAADGHLVIDNKLVVASLQPLQVPATLWGNVAGVRLLSFGTFYETGYGQLNYALGYTATPFGSTGTTPTGVNYTFYMTTWSPSTPTVVLSNTELNLSLFDSYYNPTQASISLGIITTNTPASGAGSGAAGQITSVDPGSGAVTGYTVTTPGISYAPGDVVQMVQGAGFGIYGAWLKVLTISGGGGIATSSLFNPWAGYVVGPWTAGTDETASGVELQIVGPGGTNNYSIPSYTTAYTPQQLVAALVSAINATDPNVTAAASPDGFSLVLTAIEVGSAGNSITVQDLSTSAVFDQAPPMYFGARVPDNLSGGNDGSQVLAQRYFNTASTATVGGTVYFGNLGPFILKYTEPANLQVSTVYQGVGVLRKFAGSLIGLRLHPQLGTLVPNTDMVWAWSSAEDLDEWSPITTARNVTGAGFGQIADIGDFLAGLVVASGTAFILRSQGISYATATGNAALPFAVNHIGLGDEGEGCQLPQLVCQYDQTGAFVGNSDVFQISGSISSIGTKIKAALFQALNSVQGLSGANLVNSAICVSFVGGDVFPLLVFSVSTFFGSAVGLQSFLYNVSNGTWMPLTYKNGVGIGAIDVAMVAPMATVNTTADSEILNQTVIVYGFQQQISGTDAPPYFFALLEGVPNVNSISNVAGVEFPEEEVLFGRDITWDSLYVALWADVSENTYVDFYINGVLYSTLELTPAEFNTLSGNPTEVTPPFLASYGAGADTGHAPQLTYKIRSLTDAGTAYVRFSKIMILGSFDPAQRPA